MAKRKKKPVVKHVGWVIRALRRSHNWTQPDLAGRAKMHYNTVSNFERFGLRPSTEHDTLEKLAAAMEPPMTVDAVKALVPFLDDKGALRNTEFASPVGRSDAPPEDKADLAQTEGDVRELDDDFVYAWKLATEAARSQAFEIVRKSAEARLRDRAPKKARAT